ncbi:hypothetical protein U9M48_013148 [Paspalum notatum var. saurae]|uniref:Uncharacterized protein n=1 Tax=Paspalum notatum var. saurae TaxID=547442 RepID=A0AAQ3WJA8_PASNO
MAEFKPTSDKKIPHVGLKFKNSDEAWSFWVAYGGHIGFDVRKRYTNLSKFDGKRWTREARNGSIQDRQGRNVIENPKREAQLRYMFLSNKFHSVAQKAVDYPECCVMLDNALDCLSAQLEDKLNLSTCAMNELCNEQENIDPNVQQRDDCLSAAQLKKKEVQSKGSRQQRSWIDKLRKRKPTKPARPTKKEQRDEY